MGSRKSERREAMSTMTEELEPTTADDGPQKKVVVQQAPTNGLGTAGFIVSLLGLFLTCGLLSPVGLFFSGLAMFRKPRGMAFAGVVMGGIGTAWVAVVGGMLAIGLIGGASVYQTGTAIVSAAERIEQHREQYGAYPDYQVGNELLAGVNDGWNNRVRYHLQADEAVITSAGPDGRFDTDDDITNQSPALGDGGGGMFGQLSEALDKLNEPADSEMSGLLEEALGGQDPAGMGDQSGVPTFDELGVPEPPDASRSQSSSQ